MYDDVRIIPEWPIPIKSGATPIEDLEPLC